MGIRNAGYKQTSYNPNGCQDVGDFVNNVLSWGRHVDSRYGKCFEILGGRFECQSGTLVTRRGINYSLGWMEMLQLIAGVYDLEAIQRVAPKANHSLFTYPMAYGPRVEEQMPAILQALKNDHLTRQAVLHVAKLEDGPTSNLPCTLNIQFIVRNQRVHALVTMRSWDLCRGLPYDLMMFSGLLEIVARCLGYATGTVIVHSGSTHVYMDQTDKIPHQSDKGWQFRKGAPYTWSEFQEWANQQIFLLQPGGVPSMIEYVSMEGRA